VPTTVVPWGVPTTVVPWGVADVVPWGVPTIPSTVIPGIVPWVKAAPAPVVIIIVNIIAEVNDYLIGTRDLDARFGIMKANDSIGVFVLLVIVCVGLFI
jgi:hypothetical protein